MEMSSKISSVVVVSVAAVVADVLMSWDLGEQNLL